VRQPFGSQQLSCGPAFGAAVRWKKYGMVAVVNVLRAGNATVSIVSRMQPSICFVSFAARPGVLTSSDSTEPPGAANLCGAIEVAVLDLVRERRELRCHIGRGQGARLGVSSGGGGEGDDGGECEGEAHAAGK
jgi:hypothetical protein